MKSTVRDIAVLTLGVVTVGLFVAAPFVAFSLFCSAVQLLANYP